MKPEQVRLLKETEESNGPVVYWMSHDQQAVDNWALLYAQRLTIERKHPLLAVFCLVPSFLNASLCHFDFMLDGLREVISKDRNNV